MKKLEYIIVSMIMFLVFIILQINVFNNLPILGIVPDLFIILSVYIAILADDKVLPCVLIITYGLIYDIAYSSTICLSALIGFLIVIITMEFCNRVLVEVKIGMMIYVFVCTICSELFIGIINIILSNTFYDIFSFILSVLIISAYNFVLTLFIHPILSSKIKESNNQTRIIRKY